jgi:SAM-dependent methyltransferase
MNYYANAKDRLTKNLPGRHVPNKMMDRKEFLAYMVGLPALTTGAYAMSSSRPESRGESVSHEASGDVQNAKVAAFSDQVADDMGRALLGALNYLGDRLGLFKTMSEMEEFTLEQLVTASGCNARLLEEWLKAMVAARYVEYRPDRGQYRLAPEHAAVLADEESPFFLAGWIETIVPMVLATPEVMKAFQTGKPITPDIFHPDMWEGIERGTAPLYRHQLVQNWLPAMPDVVRKLQMGGSVVDVGCGGARGVISIAKAFPKAKVFGYDPYGPSIERARENARAAGVADRAEFVVGGAQDLPERKFDLVSAFWVVHHMNQPVKDMTAIRHSLAKDGSFLIMEDNISANVLENATPWGRFVYACSTLYCLHDSMANNGAGLGTLAEPQAQKPAQQAGFGQFRRLPIEDPVIALYELKA